MGAGYPNSLDASVTINDEFPMLIFILDNGCAKDRSQEGSLAPKRPGQPSFE